MVWEGCRHGAACCTRGGCLRSRGDGVGVVQVMGIRRGEVVRRAGRVEDVRYQWGSDARVLTGLR